MRKNVKQQLALRALSTVALMAMVSSIATAAFADTYDLNKGSVDILAEGGKQYITQWEDKDNNTCVKDGEGKEIRDREDSDITLTTKDETTGETETTSNTVTIDAENKGDTANVTLQDVHIETKSSWNDSGSAPIEIKGDGDTKLELNGNNTVLSGSKNHAGIEKADVNGTGTLTIKDDLNDDNSTPKDKDENGNAVGGDTGKLVAGGFYDGAGIGGGEDGNATNITISGNAKVAAAGSNSGGAGIGGGDYGVGKNIRITDHADVTAYGGNQGAGIGGGGYRGGSVEISGNAKVFAKGANSSAGIGSGEDCRSNRPELVDTSVTISENAEVMAVGSYGAAAIGNGVSSEQGKTTVTITGGTVTAIGGESSINYWNGNCYKHLASAIGGGNSDKVQDVTVTINGTTGNTTVNASCWLDQESAISTGKGAPDIIGYDKDGKSPFGEDGSVIVRMYNHGSYTITRYGASVGKYEGDLTGYTLGTLYQTVHNRKYMEEHPEIVDITKLKDEDLHDWKLVGKVVEPTLEKDGYADYICSIDKCGQTKHVVLPKIVPDTPSTPETPDTPDTPNTPSTPDTPSTPSTPSTPDVPSTPEVTPADPAVTPDAPVQDAVPDAKPEAAPAAPAAAAALPQTGANWLAVVGSALSGLFLLAAGFVLDRKSRRMN